MGKSVIPRVKGLNLSLFLDTLTSFPEKDLFRVLQDELPKYVKASRYSFRWYKENDKIYARIYFRDVRDLWVSNVVNALMLNPLFDGCVLSHASSTLSMVVVPSSYRFFTTKELIKQTSVPEGYVRYFKTSLNEVQTKGLKGSPSLFYFDNK